MNTQPWLVACLSTLFLTACSGGPAGDSAADPEAVILVSELVGFYSLPVGWDGTSREAFMEIENPNEAGLANVIVSREDMTENCFQPDFFSGTISKDEFSDRLFLDDVTDLEDSVISLTEPDSLQIVPVAGDTVIATAVTNITPMDIQICT